MDLQLQVNSVNYTILSKTNLCSGSKNQKMNDGTNSLVWFIRILYLKQQLTIFFDTIAI